MSNAEMDKPKSNLFGDAGDLIKTGVSLWAGITGGPGGYAAAQALMGLAEGQSLGDSVNAGLSGFFNASTIGPVGSALMGNMGGGSGGSAESMGLNSFLKSMDTEEGQQRVLQNAILGGVVGGKSQAMQMGLASILNPSLNVDGRAVMTELFKNQNTVRDDELMTPAQQASMSTGERTTYDGTVLPGTPRVKMSAMGGMIEGPGTGTSDSIPATIFQNGGPVQEARLSDGEFVMTADAVRGAGGGNRDAGAANMYKMMNRLEGVA